MSHLIMDDSFTQDLASNIKITLVNFVIIVSFMITSHIKTQGSHRASFLSGTLYKIQSAYCETEYNLFEFLNVGVTTLDSTITIQIV